MKKRIKLSLLFTTLSLILLYETAMTNSPFTRQVTNENRNNRGCTHRLIGNNRLVSIGDAPWYTPPLKQMNQNIYRPNYMDAPLQKTNELDITIPAGGYFTIQFDHQYKTLNLIYPDLENPLSETVQAAIQKAPQWIQNDLMNLFSLLASPYQEKWAQAIIDAQDPYIDEIAFCIAHLSPQYLMSKYASVQLLKDNAELIYQNDQFLEYVEVVDYGSSQSDPDYYSTTHYRKVKAIDTLEVEVPRDIYYWYIVHPKITDEIPGYIDPDIIEDNHSHNNNITSPDNGYFWRDFLFNYYDEGYSKLKDLLQGCSVVRSEYTVGNNQIDNAVDILSRWIGRSLTFTSNNERPHQPVRIYRKHIGRCGEYGDMRVAIGRAALIPTANVASYSTNHVWNEFWDEGWIHWDDDINNPFVYIDSWGKKFGTVFRWKSDGSLISVTQRYTREQSTIHIYALDSNDHPIDGAMILLFTTGLDGDLWFDTYGVTDSDGKVTFIVGTDRKYYAKLLCDYGSVPSGDFNNLLRVVINSRSGQEYSVSLSVSAEKPVLSWEEIPVPQSVDNRYYLEIDFRIPCQVIQGIALLDDLGDNVVQFIKQTGGNINCMMTDESNYQNFKTAKPFQAFHSSTEIDSNIVGFEFDGQSNWYCLFDNSHSLHTLQHLVGSVSLYSVYEPDIPKVCILQNFPNPMKSMTTISYQLPQKSKVELSIYNVLGQKVKTLVNETKYAGEFEIDWDGKDESNQLVASGVYVCHIKTDHEVVSRKMLVVR